MRTVARLALGLFAASWSALTPLPVAAQQSGYVTYISGLPFNCNNWRGQPVLIVQNPYLNNIGVAHADQGGNPVIQLNPIVMGRYSPMVQAWWFAHECAHHALTPNQNSEVAADCWGIRVMRNQGMIQHPAQLEQFAYELAGLPGSMMTGHLPGDARAYNIAACALT